MPTDTKDLNQFFRVNGHLVIPMLADLARTPEILNAVETILGPNLLVWSVELFIKEAQTTKTVSWHQDITYWGMGETDDEVTAWVALSDVSVQAGCMGFIPGSHRNPIVSHHDTYDDNNLLSRGQEISGINESDAFTVHSAQAKCRCIMVAAFTHLGRICQMIDALGLPYDT